MKAAEKPPLKRRATRVQSAMIPLDSETCRKLDRMRGDMSRAACVQELIEREELEREDREKFIAAVNRDYTPEVCRQTLALNDELNAEFAVREE